MSTESDNIEQLRLQLLENGYSPIPNLDKRCFMKDWPRLQVTPELVHQWKRRERRFTATGLRIEGGLAVIDIDVNAGQDFVDEVAATIDGVVPGLSAAALVRYGKGTKEAWFVRTSESFSRIHTRRWLPVGAGPDAETYCVECFGGLSARQFGAFGPHTVDENGEVVVRYSWDGDASPATTPLGALPELGKQQFYDIITRLEELFQRFGWQPVARSTSGEGDAARVYDLTEDMFFNLSDGRRLSLSDLQQVARSEEGLRCSASWLEGPQAKRTDRCIIGTTRAGTLTVWETASGVTHLPAAAKPQDFSLDLDRVAEKLRELKDKRKFRVTSEDDAIVAAAKLRETYAFCPKQSNGIIPIWTDDLLDGMTMASFRTLMMPNITEDVGPRGGRVTINPVDIWVKDSQRKTVAGIRMRPDKPRPTYEEGGQLWVNCYSPPDLPQEGGEAETVIDFIERLLPDAAERSWFLQWLAFKLQRPDIPGPAVVMVAREFGTGRGTLGEIMKLLFGRAYVASISFDIFAGRNTQSQYTDWGASSLMVLVNESSEQNDAGSRYSAKRDTYEHLKELIEVRPIERTYVAKGARMFKAMSHTSYIISTNNMDALPIPPTDRRFAVLSNGEPVKDVGYWEALNAWMAEPANIGAFARFLREDVDLSGYSPFAAPIETTAKRDMTEAAKSDIDHGVEHALANVKGGAFVPEQIIRLMREAMRLYGLEYPDKWQAVARRMVQSKSYRVGVKQGTNWWLYHGAKRYPVYAITQALAKTLTASPAEQIKKRVMENGDPSDHGDTLAALKR